MANQKARKVVEVDYGVFRKEQDSKSNRNEEMELNEMPTLQRYASAIRMFSQLCAKYIVTGGKK